MIGEIEAAKPEYLLQVEISSSWLNWPGADRALADWGMAYIRRFYEEAGVVYIYPTHSDYVWGPEAAKERSDTSYQVSVYERKDPL
jgi:hypothetical protein